MRHSIFSRFTFVLAMMVSVLFAVPGARAQAPHGINSDGRDFFIGMMPGIPHPENFWSHSREADYVLICSYQDNNTVTISYFDVNGIEHQGYTTVLNKGLCKQVPIDLGSMAPLRPGETLEFKAGHIHARYPVSVQFYSDGSCSGGMYQAIPTAALGRSYVIASWFDNPLRNNPGSINRDSSSSEFLIIAPYENTTVTFTPNSTTYSGIVGVNSGDNSNGTPHPTTITMRKGQVYWVRSRPSDVSDDLSGSTVVSDKPIAVLGGHERALLGDPSGVWPTLDNDIRDILVEEMTPVDDWGSEYPAIPTMPASSTHVLQSGMGDMYRMFTNDSKGIFMDMWQGTAPPGAYPNSLNLYQSPAAAFENVEVPVDLIVRSKDTNGVQKKMYAVNYQYFQGHHQANVDGLAKHGKGETAQSGGDSPEDELSYRSANEMNLVPIDRWRLSTVFMVPKNSAYSGYQFIGIITTKDSLRNILMVHNSTTTASLGSMSAVKTYTIPFHPDLVGLTFQLASGSYVITGNTPFACYSYGRAELQYKDIWGYAAPTGQAYGSRDQPNPPKADITPSCDHWDVRVHESGSLDDGIAEIMLLEDPSGYYARPARVSKNCGLIDPQFTAGDTSVSFSVQIANPSQDAYAAILVTDRAGNDTVIELYYKAQSITLSQTSAQFPDVHVTAQVCSTFTVHIGATGSSNQMVVQPANFLGLDPAKSFSYTSVPPLPATVKTGDSIVFNVCFASNDTNVHKDSLMFIAGCLPDSIPVRGNALTPIIIADDYDFGAVAVGTTVCHTVRVRNVGKADLILDNNWKLHLNPDYTFMGGTPDTIKVGGPPVYLNFCFHPSTTGPSNSQMDWGTNLTSLFAHQKKDTSLLLGAGTKPGLNWDRANQPFTVECEAYDSVRVYLVNNSSGPEGANIEVNNIVVTGLNASEFQILGYGTNYPPPWQLLKSDSQWVDIKFKADLSRGYGNRNAQVFAYGQDLAGNFDTAVFNCTGIIRHAIVSITPTPYDFGAQKPGVQLTHTFTITNTGDTNFVYTGINLTGSDFTIVPGGPKVGDSLAPGASVTIVIKYTAPQNGGLSNGTLALASAHSLCEGTTDDVLGSSGSVVIATLGHDFPLNYICHTDASIVSATISGKYGIILDSVQITNGPGAMDADQFMFADDSTHLKALFMGVVNQTITFPVRFTPTKSGSVSALALFYVNDTADKIFRIDTQLITGIGYSASNALSLQNPATSDGSYTAVTANTVTVPVRLALPFDSVAQVFGMQFSLRYLSDAFRNPNVVPTSGISLVTAPVVSADPADNNYELLQIHVISTLPITNLSTVANVTWQYLVAKDSISSFQIKDLMFLGQSGAQVCWVSQGTIPATFYGQNICGDNTLRQYLKGGIPTFSIERIVPNPMTKSANVDFLVSQDGVPVTMEIYNALGQKVQTLLKDDPHAKGGYQVTLDASGMPSGLYTVFISTPGYGASKQIVVSK